jgi:hypothetical protein
MADTKISALTSATTPLAGTEVLPIVQSSTTKQVSIANVTAGRVVDLKSFNLTDTSNPYGQWIWTNGTARSYYLEGSGNLARLYSGNLSAVVQQWDITTGATRINYPLTVADNVVIGTAGKGIDFSATAGTGTSELLADYEKGTFTPTVIGTTTAGTATYAYAVGNYVKVGDAVHFQIIISWSAGTGTGNLALSGLPFTAGSSYYSVSLGRIDALALTALNIATAYVEDATTKIIFAQTPVGGGAASQVPYDANVDTIFVSGTYFI